MRLSEIIRRQVPTISAHATLHAAAIKMASHRVDVLAVIQRQNPVGTVSAYDIVTRGVAYDMDPQQIPVHRVMFPHAETVSGDANIELALRRLRPHKSWHLLVETGETGRLGLVTWHDLQTAHPDAQKTGRLLQQGTDSPPPDRRGER